MWAAIKNIAKIVGFAVAMAGLFVAIFFLMTWRPFHIAWASWVLDEHQHYMDCYELPFYAEAEKALKVHADVVESLKQAGATLEPKELKCQGYEEGLVFLKGEIEIRYSTHKQRLAIEKMIGDNFFGIAYRGVKE